jgi:hypothetical protein
MASHAQSIEPVVASAQRCGGTCSVTVVPGDAPATDAMTRGATRTRDVDRPRQQRGEARIRLIASTAPTSVTHPPPRSARRIGSRVHSGSLNAVCAPYTETANGRRHARYAGWRLGAEDVTRPLSSPLHQHLHRTGPHTLRRRGADVCATQYVLGLVSLALSHAPRSYCRVGDHGAHRGRPIAVLPSGATGRRAA